jgi:tetratricopeptide (TPR) repeat protein
MGARLLYKMVHALKAPEDAATRERCLTTAIQRGPDFWLARLELAHSLIDALEHPEKITLCSGEHRLSCEQRVEEQAKELAARRPQSSDAVELRARLLLASGKPEEAEGVLRQKCADFRENSKCLRLRVTAAAASDSPELLRAAAAALDANCLVDCVQVRVWLGDLLAARGDWQLAMTYYERALSDGGSDDVSFKLANVASKAGAHARAAELFARLSIRRRDRALLDRVAEERSQALRNTVQE